MTTYQFPEVDFSWLGKLPTAMEDARRQARMDAARESLADLDPRDPKSLEAAGARLISAGDIEGGVKLWGAATARRGVDQRGADAAAYNAFIQNYLKQNQGGGGGEPDPMQYLPPNPAGIEGVTPPVAPAPVGPGPMTPLPPQVRPFPTSEAVPPVVGPQVAALPPTAPGNINIPPQGPEGAQIAAALAPPPQVPPPPATALAGPPPQPDTAPPVLPNQPPPGFNPNFYQPPIDTTPAPATVATAPVAPPATLPIRGPEAAAAEAARRAALMAPKGGSPSQNAALTQPLRDISADTKLTSDQKDWVFAQRQRAAQGLPYQLYSDWKLSNDSGINNTRYKQYSESLGQYKAAGDKAQALTPVLEAMDAISRDPAFVSGKNINLRDENVSRFQGAVQALRQAGVPEELLPRLDNLKTMKSTQLNEVFTALRNQAVLAASGGLGRQISDQDRNYYDAAYPSLSTTPEGMRLLIKFQQEAADHNKAVYNLARAYDQKNGVKGSMSGLDDAVYKYNQEHQLLKNPDGSPTQLARDMSAELAKRDQPQTGQTLDAAGAKALEINRRLVQGMQNAVTGVQSGARAAKDYIARDAQDATSAVGDIGSKLQQGYDAFTQRLKDAYTAIKARGGNAGEILQVVPGGQLIQNDQTGKKAIRDPKTGRIYPIED